MQRFECNCGAKVFFENSTCVSCGSELGWCPACDTMRSLARTESGQFQCGSEQCGTILTKCYNYEVEQVCNRCLPADSVSSEAHALCDYCRFNETIPDLSVEGNKEKWQRIELAKRRLFYTLDRLGVPYGDKNDGANPPLSFDFKGDIISTKGFWRKMTNTERVYTGHAEGKVTINIKEADSVELEKSRVSLEEAHRTIIGHFRHEIGHYVWDLLVKDRCEPDFVSLFGDHNNPDYSAALDHYYEHGPKDDWKENYVSAYATMHPWEDFAESFAAYMDMVSVLDIAISESVTSLDDITVASFQDMTARYTHLGVLINEMNRTMGLLDLVPEIFTSGVLQKMEFIHNLLRAGASHSPQAH